MKLDPDSGALRVLRPMRPRAAGDRLVRGAGLALVLALGCAPPPPAEPTGPLTADFASPRPAAGASLLEALRHRTRRGDLRGALRGAEEAKALAPRSAAATLREAELRAALAAWSGDGEGLNKARADVEAVLRELPDEAAPRLSLAQPDLA